jgi:hypothetical protein
MHEKERSSFEPTESLRPSESGGHRRLVDDANTRLLALLADSGIPESEKIRLLEGMLDRKFRASDAELETASQRVRREGREEGERHALLDVAARFAPDALPVLHTIEELDALRRAVDDALSRKLLG